MPVLGQHRSKREHTAGQLSIAPARTGRALGYKLTFRHGEKLRHQLPVQLDTVLLLPEELLRQQGHGHPEPILDLVLEEARRVVAARSRILVASFALAVDHNRRRVDDSQSAQESRE